MNLSEKLLSKDGKDSITVVHIDVAVKKKLTTSEIRKLKNAVERNLPHGAGVGVIQNEL